MNLLPLAQKLEDVGLGIQSETIFINMIPVECPQGILLKNSVQGTKINYYLPGYFKSQFKLIVRSSSYTNGETLASAVAAALTINETQLGSMYFKYIRPATKPVAFPLSNGNLIEFAVDFDVVFCE
jgi:hypothetical protein